MTLMLVVVMLTSQFCQATESTSSTTATNPLIDTDELTLLLSPLTVDELNIEVAAWFGILRVKAREVSEAEILINQEKKRISNVQKIVEVSKGSATIFNTRNSDDVSVEKLKKDIEKIKLIANSFEQEKANQVVNEMTKSGESLTELSKKAESVKNDLQKRRGYLIKNLTHLRSNKNEVSDRFQLVINAWEDKGGKGDEYHLYIKALSGTAVDLTDSDAAWLTVEGWLVSSDGGLKWLANVIKFFISLIIVYILSITIGKIIDTALNRNKKASILLKKFIQISLRRVIIIIGFIMSLTLIEIDVTPLLALIGAAGLVVGLALQGTLSNFASGMLILIYRPFDVGDIITTDGVSGTVHSMTLLSTSVRTFDNQHLIVPNNTIWGSTITNVTGSKTRRVDLVFGIGYHDDIAKAEAIMQGIVDNHPLVLKSPEPIIKVNELGQSSVNFVCRPWVITENYRNVFWDITRQVKEEFTKQGVTIPFPQHDVHVYNITDKKLDNTDTNRNGTNELVKTE